MSIRGACTPNDEYLFEMFEWKVMLRSIIHLECQITWIQMDNGHLNQFFALNESNWILKRK